MTEKIDIGYRPREPQKLIHKAVRDHRFNVVVAHRRMGKTVSAINQLIHSAIKCNKKNPRLAYIAPTYNQSKRIAWDYLLEYTRPLKATANIAELRVDFLGRRISLYGADNPDSLRGIYLDGVVIDEIGDINPNLFSEIIRPAIAEREGWVMFIGTPKGANHFKTLRDKAELKTDDWHLLEFKASDTQILPQKELDAAFREMGEDKFMQEFECSFAAAVEGAYYGKMINDLTLKNRVTDIEVDGIAKTFCAWDLGIGDSTAIWVCQAVGQEVRLIDFVENHGVGLDYYVNWLRDHNYENATQLLPHDVNVRELGSGRSRKEMLEEAGLIIDVVPKLGVDDGIQAVRRMLPRCWFDHKVKQGLDALRNYRRQYDEKRDVFFDKPVHDWCSHAADAFRYLAVGLDEGTSNWDKPLQINTSWVV
jgi:phage terminase large subunit